MAEGITPAIHVHDPTRGRFGNGERIRHCQEALLGPSGLDHIAFQTSGQDFTVDRLAERPEPGRTEVERQHLSELGNQLAARFAAFDAAVRPWQSGVLIRLVLHGAKRLVVCNAVTAEQLLVASAPLDKDAPLDVALEPDRRASTLTDTLRELVKLSSQDPGGFHTEPADAVELIGTAVAPGEHLDVTGVPGRVADVLTAAVDPADLHYAAYVRGGVWQCSADVLGHPKLARFFSRAATVEMRRWYCQKFGSGLCTGPESLIGQLTLEAEDTIGQIGRMVIDVERGAFFLYRLGDDDFVLGLTLDQGQVTNADLRIAKVADKLGG